MSSERFLYIYGGNKNIVYYLYEYEYMKYLARGIKLTRLT